MVDLKAYKMILVPIVVLFISLLLGLWVGTAFMPFAYKVPVDVRHLMVPQEQGKEILKVRQAKFEIQDALRPLEEGKDEVVLSPEEASIKREGINLSEFKLGMIVIAEHGRYAFINNILLREGDVVQGSRVQEITKEGILLSKSGETAWLK